MHAKQNSMKKKTVVITIIIVLVIVGLVGAYTFLSRRAYSSVDNTKLSQVQLVLSYVLQIYKNAFTMRNIRMKN